MTSERMREIVARHKLSGSFESILVDLWLECDIVMVDVFFRFLKDAYQFWPRSEFSKLFVSDSLEFCDFADVLQGGEVSWPH